MLLPFIWHLATRHLMHSVKKPDWIQRGTTIPSSCRISLATTSRPPTTSSIQSPRRPRLRHGNNGGNPQTPPPLLLNSTSMDPLQLQRGKIHQLPISLWMMKKKANSQYPIWQNSYGSTTNSATSHSENYKRWQSRASFQSDFRSVKSQPVQPVCMLKQQNGSGVTKQLRTDQWRPNPLNQGK